MKEIFIDIMNQPIRYINSLDTVFNQLQKNKRLYEGFKIPLFRGLITESPKYKVGSIINFPEFLSTSISKSTAYEFQKCGETPCCIYIFHLNDNIPFIPIDYDMKYINIRATSEHEILLPRNTYWKLVKKYKATINPEDTLTCTYERIKGRKKIYTYEFEAVEYKQPQAIQELNNDILYDHMFDKNYNNNPNFFTLKNNISLSYVTPTKKDKENKDDTSSKEDSSEQKDKNPDESLEEIKPVQKTAKKSPKVGKTKKVSSKSAKTV